MSRKIYIPIFAALIVALLTGLWMTGEASAQTGSRFKRRLALRALGEVTAIADDSFTVKRLNGEEQTFQVNEDTHFLNREKQELSFADLQTGLWVLVIPIRDGEQKVARTVLVLPEDFDPSNIKPRPQKFLGEVIAVDPSGLTFTLHTRRTDLDVSFVVNDETRFRSKDGVVESLEDLKPGMLSIVLARKDGDHLVALAVAAGTADQFPKFEERVGGRVVLVDREYFTLETRNGDQYTVLVSDETRFRSRGGKVNGIQDLKEGMVVLVGGEILADGRLQAQVVLVGLRRR